MLSDSSCYLYIHALKTTCRLDDDSNLSKLLLIKKKTEDCERKYSGNHCDKRFKNIQFCFV